MARKRYGRNQKRAHREEIARLKAEVQRLEADALVSLRSINRYSEALAAQVREMEVLVKEIRTVCRHSALLPAHEVALPGDGPWELALNDRRPLLHLANLPEEPWVSIATVSVYEVRALLERSLETFRKIVHVKLPDREVRFAISREAMTAFGRHGLREVARNLFSMLWGALREEATSSDALPPPGGPGTA